MRLSIYSIALPRFFVFDMALFQFGTVLEKSMGYIKPYGRSITVTMLNNFETRWSSFGVPVKRVIGPMQSWRKSRSSVLALKTML